MAKLLIDTWIFKLRVDLSNSCGIATIEGALINNDSELGRPSYAWGFGQERRLKMVRKILLIGEMIA